MPHWRGRRRDNSWAWGSILLSVSTRCDWFKRCGYCSCREEKGGRGWSWGLDGIVSGFLIIHIDILITGLGWLVFCLVYWFSGWLFSPEPCWSNISVIFIFPTAKLIWKCVFLRIDYASADLEPSASLTAPVHDCIAFNFFSFYSVWKHSSY